jgi:hypothetical protein
MRHMIEAPSPAVTPGSLRHLEPILQFFDYGHLHDPLQAISKPFGELALRMVSSLPRNAERSTALRKLLEAKDAAVRAQIYASVSPEVR